MPGQVPSAVLDHLILVYVAATVVFGLTSAVVLARYPLSEADHKARLETLVDAARRAAALPSSEVDPPPPSPV